MKQVQITVIPRRHFLLLCKITIFKQYVVIDLNISIMLLCTIMVQLPREVE